MYCCHTYKHLFYDNKFTLIIIILQINDSTRNQITKEPITRYDEEELARRMVGSYFKNSAKHDEGKGKEKRKEEEALTCKDFQNDFEQVFGKGCLDEYYQTSEVLATIKREDEAALGNPIAQQRLTNERKEKITPDLEVKRIKKYLRITRTFELIQDLINGSDKDAVNEAGTSKSSTKSKPKPAKSPFPGGPNPEAPASTVTAPAPAPASAAPETVTTQSESANLDWSLLMSMSDEDMRRVLNNSHGNTYIRNTKKYV